MTVYSKHEPGTFCWIDLATTDQKSAKEFYSRLFGWKANDIPVGDKDVYSMMQIGGKDVGAIYEQAREQRDMGISPYWFTYVSVESADDTAGKAKSLGGILAAEPFDVFDSGRMAVIKDPTGALFGIWQPKENIGVGVKMETGTLCWTELLTGDPSAAGEFYAKLFGWTSKTDKGGYTEFLHAGNSHAGMMQIQKEWGDVPSNWGVYFVADDCDKTIEQAAGLGAKVVVPASDVEGVGRFGTLSDPQGATFSVIRLEG